MNKRKGIHGFQICGLVLIMVSMLAICLSGCGKEEEQQPADIKDEAAVEESVEESVEVQESVEEMVAEESTEEIIVEEEVEDDTANLSNEEWVNSLMLEVERPTYLVFNELTGEKKELDDGAEYTLVEGDELGIITPVLWAWESENARLYVTTEFKYNCEIFIINLDLIEQKTEFTNTYINRDGSPVSVTVYLSK